jgi:hypothetical protein
MKGHRRTTPTPPSQIRCGNAFSSIVRCPLEIPRLVVPPVGAHRAPIVAPRRVPDDRAVPPMADLEGTLETPIHAVPSVAIPATAPKNGLIDRGPTGARRRAVPVQAPPATTRSPMVSARHVATTATSATLAVASVVLDPAVPGATSEPPAERPHVMTEPRDATSRARRATAVASTTRRCRADPERTIIDRAPRNVPLDHLAARVATTRTRVIDVRVSRRGIDRRVARVPNVRAN